MFASAWMQSPRWKNPCYSKQNYSTKVWMMWNKGYVLVVMYSWPFVQISCYITLATEAVFFYFNMSLAGSDLNGSYGYISMSENYGMYILIPGIIDKSVITKITCTHFKTALISHCHNSWGFAANQISKLLSVYDNSDRISYPVSCWVKHKFHVMCMMLT